VRSAIGEVGAGGREFEMSNVECRMKNEERVNATGLVSPFFIPHSTFDISVFADER
jgi:hypothetical protein